MALTARQTGDRLPVASASGTIASGALVVQEGLFGVALKNATIGQSLTLGARGVWVLPVPALTAKGTALYLSSLADQVAPSLIADPSDAFFVGVTTDAIDGDGNAPVLLGPQSPRAESFVAFAIAPVGAVTTPAEEGAVLGNAVFKVIDDNGITDTESTAEITLTIDGDGGGVLSGDKVKNAVAGVVAFTDLTVDADGTYVITAASPGVASGFSSEFVIVNPIPTKLEFDGAVTTPAVEGAVLGNVKVNVLNVNDDLCVDSTTEVTVALTVAGGAVLGGDKVKNAVAGVATFDDLTVDKDGSYTLTATATDLTSGVSTVVVITNP